MTQTPSATPEPAKRVRPPPRRVTVLRTRRLTPRVVQLTFGGEGLAGFATPRPGGHMKLMVLPPAANDWTPASEGARPPMRTYTPRSYDAARNELEVEFVMHGSGLASSWAEQVQPGEALYIAGPGGGYDIPAGTQHLLLMADDTAMPAAGMIIEALPAGCTAQIICEVEDTAEERPLSPRVDAAVQWLHRATANTASGALLLQAAGALALPAGAACWIACEAGMMRRIRDTLLAAGVARSQIHGRGYWKAGETAYPDHDYGDDT
jgi:NADPH-dependent ferric siderophore reductase